MYGVELPTGWEKRRDEASGKIYFINHSKRKTQWDDPRIRHESVWRGRNHWRTDILKVLQEQFPSCDEHLLREGLIEYNFDTKLVADILIQTGYKSTKSDTEICHDTRHPKSPNAVHLSDPMTSNPTDDPFGIMYLKSRFSTVADIVIKNVLVRCNNDTKKATELLMSMGYEDREIAGIRLKEQENESKRLSVRGHSKEEQNQADLSKLSLAFPSISNDQLLEYLTARKHNYSLTLSDLLANEFNMDHNSVVRLVESSGQDIEQIRKKIRIIQRLDRVETHIEVITTRDDQSPIMTIENGNRIPIGESANSVAKIAKKPEPLYKGTDLALLSNQETLAVGPDPNNQRGPIKSIRKTANCDSDAVFGNRQSPIAFHPNHVQYVRTLVPNSIKMNYNLGDCSDLTVHPTGWTVRAKDQCFSTLTANHLPTVFRLAQFHAHWRNSGENGSEHFVEGSSFSGEMHFIFWNTDYRNYKESLKHGDGLAVLGVFLKVYGPSNCPLFSSFTQQSHTDNPHYRPLIECVRTAIDSCEKQAFPKDCDIEKMLPEELHFWTYLGSLTTLPHNECVIWTVFKDPVCLSDSQLKVFREIVQDNSRVTQNLASRTIGCSFAN